MACEVWSLLNLLKVPTRTKKEGHKHWRTRLEVSVTETAITLLGQLIWASPVRVKCGGCLRWNSARVCVSMCLCYGEVAGWDAGVGVGGWWTAPSPPRPAIYGGTAADERGAVNRPAGGVFHTELAFMKNTRTAPTGGSAWPAVTPVCDGWRKTHDKLHHCL